MGFFGKSKSEKEAATKADTTTSVMKLRQAVEDQEKREGHLQRKIDLTTQDAKAKMARGDKKGAMFAMKKKKLYEKEMDKIMNVKMTLETQQMNLESATHNAETFKAMHNGTSAMGKIRKLVGIEKVDDMMDDMRDEMDATDEISNALAQPLDPMMDDDADLLAELDQLEREDIDSRFPSAPWGRMQPKKTSTATSSASSTSKNKVPLRASAW